MTVEHLHLWSVASSHFTSDGPVVYERCRCGAYRLRQGADT
ncbi:hypothetical protein ABFT23_16965 [Nocardioides sp. C4-1]